LGVGHVAELGFATATDRQIWDEATLRSAILVTKDRDFPVLRLASNVGPTIVWVRVGNVKNRVLIAQMVRALPKIVSAVERGETVIELVGR
jgi:predicted nuclease of predicted toxin-antitoxin system